MSHLILGQSAFGNSLFSNLIRRVSAAESKLEEDWIISKERDTLQEVISQPEISVKRMKDYLLCLIYCDMLGYDVSFGHIHAINFLQKGKSPAEKRVGYLAVCTFMHPKHDLLLLLINSLQKDISSSNYSDVCSALSLVSFVLAPDMIPAIAPAVKKLIAHDLALVRKKAIMVMFKMETSDDFGKNFDFDFVSEVIKKGLLDKDPSVMAATLHWLQDLGKRHYKTGSVGLLREYIPPLLNILQQILANRLPRDYEYHSVPAPWLQIRILKILGCLARGNRAASIPLYPVLLQILKRGVQSWGQVGFSVVYECIRVATLIYPNPEVVSECADAVSGFLGANINNNLKYVGIQALIDLVQVDPSYAGKHQMVVIECLDNDDETLRNITLELLYRICNSENVAVVVDKMLNYLRGAVYMDSAGRRVLVVKVMELSEKYAPGVVWYLQTICEVLRVGGDCVEEWEVQGIIDILSENIANEEAIEAKKNAFIFCQERIETWMKSEQDCMGKEDSMIEEEECYVMCWVASVFASSVVDVTDRVDEIKERGVRLCEGLALYCNYQCGYKYSAYRSYILITLCKVVFMFGLAQSQQKTEAIDSLFQNEKYSLDPSVAQTAGLCSALMSSEIGHNKEVWSLCNDTKMNTLKSTDMGFLRTYASTQPHSKGEKGKCVEGAKRSLRGKSYPGESADSRNDQSGEEPSNSFDSPVVDRSLNASDESIAENNLISLADPNANANRGIPSVGKGMQNVSPVWGPSGYSGIVQMERTGHTVGQLSPDDEKTEATDKNDNKNANVEEEDKDSMEKRKLASQLFQGLSGSNKNQTANGSAGKGGESSPVEISVSCAKESFCEEMEVAYTVELTLPEVSNGMSSASLSIFTMQNVQVKLCMGGERVSTSVCPPEECSLNNWIGVRSSSLNNIENGQSLFLLLFLKFPHSIETRDAANGHWPFLDNLLKEKFLFIVECRARSDGGDHLVGKEIYNFKLSDLQTPCFMTTKEFGASWSAQPAQQEVIIPVPGGFSSFEVAQNSNASLTDLWKDVVQSHLPSFSPVEFIELEVILSCSMLNNPDICGPCLVHLSYSSATKDDNTESSPLRYSGAGKIHARVRCTSESLCEAIVKQLKDIVN
eukprot:Nk52_evm2s260 gene=Nk52_evmTU2s260